MPKKVLVVLTSHSKLGDTGKPTGFWLEELAAPYFVFKEAGLEVTLASPLGGQPPLDPKSDDPSAATPATNKWKDSSAQAQLAKTVKLAEVQTADFDAVFYPGGHGPLWDLVDDTASLALISDFWAAGKPVSAVCHAPIVFKNAKDASGNYIVSGRACTGFTNSEEEAVGLSSVVPHLVEDSLKACGGNFVKEADWTPHTEQDGMLITGQNPASSEKVAHLVIAALQ